MKHVKKDYGFYAFYRGIKPNIVGIILYKGISFFTYEEVLSFLKHN